MEEVELAINEMKKGKAKGVDRIPIELATCLIMSKQLLRR